MKSASGSSDREAGIPGTGISVESASLPRSGCGPLRAWGSSPVAGPPGAFCRARVFVAGSRRAGLVACSPLRGLSALVCKRLLTSRCSSWSVGTGRPRHHAQPLVYAYVRAVSTPFGASANFPFCLHARVLRTPTHGHTRPRARVERRNARRLWPPVPRPVAYARLRVLSPFRRSVEQPRGTAASCASRPPAPPLAFCRGRFLRTATERTAPPSPRASSERLQNATRDRPVAPSCTKLPHVKVPACVARRGARSVSLNSVSDH
jgi:hypothetical protein